MQDVTLVQILFLSYFSLLQSTFFSKVNHSTVQKMLAILDMASEGCAFVKIIHSYFLRSSGALCNMADRRPCLVNMPVVLQITLLKIPRCALSLLVIVYCRHLRIWVLISISHK